METGLTEIDLANFTGRSPDHYTDQYVMEALDQAADLFEIATRLTTFPTSGLAGRLARRGVLAMADALFEALPYRDLKNSPFKSETIGSYTYSLAESSVLSGIPTRVAWFDLAVDRLAAYVSATISNDSVAAFDRPGDLAAIDGRTILVGPADSEDFVQGPYRSGGAQGL